MMPFQDTLTCDHPGYVQELDMSRYIGANRVADRVFDTAQELFYGPQYMAAQRSKSPGLRVNS